MTTSTIQRLVLLGSLLAMLPWVGFAQKIDPEVLLWREEHRAFLLDGPAWLIDVEVLDALMVGTEEEREAIISRVLSEDPDLESTRSELQEAIERRRALVQLSYLTYLDARARLLFVHGEPVRRELMSCDQTFKPIEVWWYSDAPDALGYVLYEPKPELPYVLWLPLDGKEALYHQEMAYWLQQIAEIKGPTNGPRFDKTLCKQTKLIDEVTGVRGLYDYQKGRPSNDDIMAIFARPTDLAAWAREAAATPLPETKDRLRAGAPRVFFPEENGQRMLVRMLVELPDESGLVIFQENEKTEVRVKIDGLIERAGERFDDFHMRFQVPMERVEPVALVVDQLLRPGDTFLVRMRITDEIGGGIAFRQLSFKVPSDPDAEDQIPEGIRVAQGSVVIPERVAGIDSLVIIPPQTDVVLGLWRAETLVSGENIKKVVFLVDGQAQFTRGRPPFEAELRLSRYPTEQAIRVEGYDEDGELIASDEVILNQQRGQLEIDIAEPPRGATAVGEVLARANVVVPEEKNVVKVEFLVNDEIQAELAKPPWVATVTIPAATNPNDLQYLTAAVYLDDGTRAEDVRFLNQPEYLEEVEVDFVELYTSVDGDDTLTLKQEAFRVFEDGREQSIAKFELVDDLPITIGIALDTSGSMIESLPEAKRAALDFLRNLTGPQDKSFAVAFSNRPNLIMARTSDVGAVQESLEGLHAVGNTSLYDAIVTSLYYFRGVRNRRALILLSDGEDTASGIEYKDALEYARRSGVVIYTIGLQIPKISMGVRGKLAELAAVTGGRSFFISKATDLGGVYSAIERELRSQYLLAYLSDAPQESKEFRMVEIKMKGGLKARAMSGYYP